MTVPLTTIERPQPLLGDVEHEHAPNALEIAYAVHVGHVVPTAWWKRGLDVAVSAALLLALTPLFNVLTGSMSLVGPRPPLPAEVRCYQPRHLFRLQAVPGITGKWQIEARGHYDFEEMVALDVAYAEHFGFAQDVSILLKTVPAVL